MGNRKTVADRILARVIEAKADVDRGDGEDAGFVKGWEAACEEISRQILALRLLTHGASPENAILLNVRKQVSDIKARFSEPSK